MVEGIYAKLQRHEALSPQEEAFKREDDEQFEIDPFGKLQGFMADVFGALKAGGTTPTEAEQAFNAFLETQRRIYGLNQAKKRLEGGETE